MTPAEAIVAATINGAHAIRRGARAGSLEPGKDADLIILNAADYREIPYHFGWNQVHLTMKRGDHDLPRGCGLQRNGGAMMGAAPARYNKRSAGHHRPQTRASRLAARACARG